MKLTPCETPQTRIFRYGKTQKIIKEFVHMNVACCHVDWRGHYSAASSAAGALNSSIKSLNKNNIVAISRKNECYLIRKDLVN